jgi:hypothetical protein
MAYSTITERTAVSERLIIDAILPSLHGVKPNRSQRGWSFFCPLPPQEERGGCDLGERRGLDQCPLFRLPSQRRTAESPGGSASARQDLSTGRSSATGRNDTPAVTNELSGQDMG